jgi:hypothetical protein
MKQALAILPVSSVGKRAGYMPDESTVKKSGMSLINHPSISSLSADTRS